METLHAQVDRSHATSDASGAAKRYLRAMNAASSDLLDRLSAAAQIFDDEGSFQSAAAAQRRLTRQFLDGQRSLLRQRAKAIAVASETEADARAAAEAIVGEAYEAAGVERPAGALGPTATEVARPDDFTGAVADLQRLLDEWWRSELANSDELLGRACETADLIRSLARIEAGEVLAHAGVPSRLPPPLPTFHDRELLPVAVARTIATSDGSDLLEMCDSLLRDLGDQPATTAAVWEPPAPPMPWVPPVGEPQLPASIAPITSVDALAEIGAGPVVSAVDVPAPEGEDAFRRFWGEGPESHRSRGGSIVRQAVVSMLAFTGVLTLVMAVIG